MVGQEGELLSGAEEGGVQRGGDGRRGPWEGGAEVEQMSGGSNLAKEDLVFRIRCYGPEPGRGVVARKNDEKSRAT